MIVDASQMQLGSGGATGNLILGGAQNCQLGSASPLAGAPSGISHIRSLISAVNNKVHDSGLASLAMSGGDIALGCSQESNQKHSSQSSSPRLAEDLNPSSAITPPLQPHFSGSSEAGRSAGSDSTSGDATCNPVKLSWARVVGGTTRQNNRMKLQYFNPSRIDESVHVAPTFAVLEDGAQAWSHCLVGYFVGSKLPFSAINSIARKIWTKDGLLDVHAQSNGFIFFRFSTKDGVTTILEKDPWLFAGQYLALKKWESGLKLYKDPTDKIPVWIQMHHIPMEYWTEEGLSYLATRVLFLSCRFCDPVQL